MWTINWIHRAQIERKVSVHFGTLVLRNWILLCGRPMESAENTGYEGRWSCARGSWPRTRGRPPTWCPAEGRESGGYLGQAQNKISQRGWLWFSGTVLLHILGALLSLRTRYWEAMLMVLRGVNYIEGKLSYIRMLPAPGFMILRDSYIISNHIKGQLLSPGTKYGCTRGSWFWGAVIIASQIIVSENNISPCGDSWFWWAVWWYLGVTIASQNQILLSGGLWICGTI